MCDPVTLLEYPEYLLFMPWEWPGQVPTVCSASFGTDKNDNRVHTLVKGEKTSIYQQYDDFQEERVDK